MTRRERPRLVPRLMGARVVGLALVTVLALGAPAWAAGDDAAQGRKHAQRASHLAASGKCRQALAEYDKAIAVLHDPTLLFNRGECHRKLGDADAALEDYNQFLADLPNAPNRAQVEERIAELRKQAVPAPAAVAAAPAPVAPPPEPRKPVAVAPSVQPVPAAPPPAPAPETTPGTVLAASGDSASASEASSGGDALTGRPWFWVALGAVVVGAGVGAYFVLARDPTNIPRSDLGNYRF